MSTKYTLGIDFGTLSGRAVLVSVSDGVQIASEVREYRSGVISGVLPSTGEKLPDGWALQDPSDYVDVLAAVVPGVLAKAGVSPGDVIGVGVDFTSSTAFPVYADGTPLCLTDKWRGEKNAWCKLWKHHSTQKYADRLNEVYARRGDDFLSHLGDRFSPEWMLPKVLETLTEAPGVYEDCAYIIEAGDWINLLLTGRLTRGYQPAAYKSSYLPGRGYPPDAFLEEVDPRLRGLFSGRLGGPVLPWGSRAGTVTPEAAARFGLAAGTAVAPALCDAHAGAFALGVCRPGDLFGILGTSNCYFILSDTDERVPGICGCVPDGTVPGLYCLEAGLCCAGDHFAWAAENVCPYEYRLEADRRGISPLRLLIGKAAELEPGESGLVALDWWNGNRSVLVNGLLSGAIFGLTLSTRPEHIMRALIEATAFGTRTIFDAFASQGLGVGSFVAAGGIAGKDPFTMQLYSDVLHLPIRVTSTLQAPAAGSAVHAAVAAGPEAGGYSGFASAMEAMKAPVVKVYEPDADRGRIYDRLYAEYTRLHDYFGRGGSDVMLRLRDIRG